MQPRMMVQKVWSCGFALSLCGLLRASAGFPLTVQMGGFPAQPMVGQRGPKHPLLLNLPTSLESAAFSQEVPARLCGDREIILGFICGGWKKANSKLCETTFGDNNLQQMSRLFNVRLTREPSEIINAYMCLLVRQITFRYYFSWISPPNILLHVLPRSDIPFIPCKNERKKPNLMGKSTDCKTPRHTCITLNTHMKSRSEKSGFTPINSKCQRHQKNLHVSTVRLSQQQNSPLCYPKPHSAQRQPFSRYKQTLHQTLSLCAQDRTSWQSHALQDTQGEQSLELKATCLSTSEIFGFPKYHEETKTLQLLPCSLCPYRNEGVGAKRRDSPMAQCERLCQGVSLCNTSLSLNPSHRIHVCS